MTPLSNCVARGVPQVAKCPAARQDRFGGQPQRAPSNSAVPHASTPVCIPLGSPRLDSPIGACRTVVRASRGSTGKVITIAASTGVPSDGMNEFPPSCAPSVVKKLVERSGLGARRLSDSAAVAGCLGHQTPHFFFVNLLSQLSRGHNSVAWKFKIRRETMLIRDHPRKSSQEKIIFLLSVRSFAIDG